MSDSTLPAHPSLEQLKKQAKELLDAITAHKPDAVELFAKHHPGGQRENQRFALHDAQLVLARQYGFTNWAKLKEEVALRLVPSDDAIGEFRRLVQSGDADGLRSLLQRQPALKRKINALLFSFDSPAIRIAAEKRNRELVEVLLEAGADINKKSEWKAGGFGVLDEMEEEFGEYLISKGAIVDIHGAASLGKLGRLEALLKDDASLANARGGDGATPLHFAKNVPVIDMLLHYGADVTIRDLDHASTAAMWQVRNRENCFRLIEAGSPIDIFMACVHGDTSLAERALKEDPDCLSSVIGSGKFRNATGGDIYFWKISIGARPIAVAAHFEHAGLVSFLLPKAPPAERLLYACTKGNIADAQAILAGNPNLRANLTNDQLKALPDAILSGNTDGIRGLLAIGFPLTGRGMDNGSPLHIAAWKGDLDTVRELLRRGAPVEDTGDKYHVTPLGWASHGVVNCRNPKGDYPGVVRLLLEAGAIPSPDHVVQEHPEMAALIRAALEERGSALEERANRLVLAATRQERSGTSARDALAAEPALANANFWTQCVTGNAEALREALKRDPKLATGKGGPQKDWSPIHCVSFSSLQMENVTAQARFAECARLLLDAGGDPNASWSAKPWPDAPLSALYGATGVNNNPSLARLLLERGADVNDGESLPHATEHFHLESLEVLREFGVDLGVHPRWNTTALNFLLGAFTANNDGWPVCMKGVRWLLEHGCDPNIPCGNIRDTALHAAIRQSHNSETIRLLLDFGADPNLANRKGVTPVALSQRSGRRDLVPLLRERGGREVELMPKEQFFEAALSGDEAAMQALLSENTSLFDELDEEDHLAIHRAAEAGNANAVRLLLDAGFDIAYKGIRDWGSTPLHLAAWNGWADVVELLLARGAPIKILANKPEESPPLGWAIHGSGACRNSRGDFPRAVRLLLAAGATPQPAIVASPEVKTIMNAALAGKAE